MRILESSSARDFTSSIFRLLRYIYRALQPTTRITSHLPFRRSDGTESMPSHHAHLMTNLYPMHNTVHRQAPNYCGSNYGSKALPGLLSPVSEWSQQKPAWKTPWLAWFLAAHHQTGHSSVWQRLIDSFIDQCMEASLVRASALWSKLFECSALSLT